MFLDGIGLGRLDDRWSRRGLSYSKILTFVAPTKTPPPGGVSTSRPMQAGYSMDGFHTFQTFPTRSGPGVRVGLPGSQPAGQASFPPVARTCWKA